MNFYRQRKVFTSLVIDSDPLPTPLRSTNDICCTACFNSRKTLSHKATRIANDNGGFHYYCANNAERDTDVPTYINEGGRYYRIYSERPIEHICNPSSQGGNVEIRDGERHQICSQGRHLYCYQEEKNVEVVYRSGFYLKKKKFKVPTDCVCGVENPLD